MPYYRLNGLVGGMAAFKAHVDIAFRRAKEMRDPEKLFGKGSSMAAIQLRSPKELPAQKTLIAYIREAISLNGKPEPKRKPVKVPPLPDDLAQAMRGNRKAKTAYDNFPPSQQREYMEWITDAKQAATRERRIAQAIEWLSEGKPRNWKYMKRS